MGFRAHETCMSHGPPPRESQEGIAPPENERLEPANDLEMKS